MISKTDIIKLSKHVFSRSQGIADKRIIHPRRDWAIGLLLLIVCMIGGGYMGARAFIQYQNFDVEMGEASVVLPRFNESDVLTTIERFEAKADAFSALIAEPVTPTNNLFPATGDIQASAPSATNTATSLAGTEVGEVATSTPQISNEPEVIEITTSTIPVPADSIEVSSLEVQ